MTNENYVAAVEGTLSVLESLGVFGEKEDRSPYAQRFTLYFLAFLSQYASQDEAWALPFTEEEREEIMNSELWKIITLCLRHDGTEMYLRCSCVHHPLINGCVFDVSVDELKSSPLKGSLRKMAEDMRQPYQKSRGDGQIEKIVPFLWAHADESWSKFAESLSEEDVQCHF